MFPSKSSLLEQFDDYKRENRPQDRVGSTVGAFDMKYHGQTMLEIYLPSALFDIISRSRSGC